MIDWSKPLRRTIPRGILSGIEDLSDSAQRMVLLSLLLADEHGRLQKDTLKAAWEATQTGTLAVIANEVLDLLEGPVMTVTWTPPTEGR